MKSSPSELGISARRDTKSGRFYEVEGELYPSVTNVLEIISKPLLIPWAAKQERLQCIEAAANLYEDLAKTPAMSRPAYIATLEGRIGKQKASAKELAKAGEIGSQAHALIEWNIRKSLGQTVGPEPKVSDKALWAFMACEDWMKRVNFVPHYIEQVVFSQTYGVAGTMDCLAEVDWDGRRRIALVDWKTGKAIYPESFCQNAAYRKCMEEMGHEVAEIGLIVRLPKIETDPEFEVVECPDYEGCWQAFLAALRLWQWREGMKD